MSSEEPSQFTVRGTIRDAEGRPLRGAAVRAADRDLRSEQLLGEAQTDADGGYRITYTRERFVRLEKQRADVVVRVVVDGEQAAAESPVVFQADFDTVVDLVVRQASAWQHSEYERHLKELSPLLGNVTVGELTDDDRSFLEKEAGIPADHLFYLTLDARWSVKCAPPSTFYALLRQGLPTDLRRLLARPSAEWAAALKASLSERLVPSALSEHFDEILTCLGSLSDEQTLSEPLGAALATTSLDDRQRRAVVSFLRDHPDVADPWEPLAKVAGLDEAALAQTRFTLEVLAFVGEHLPTVRALQRIGRERGWSRARDLARLDRCDWSAVAESYQKDLPEGVKDPAQWARSLASRVEQAFPTDAIRHRLADDEQPRHCDVNAFLRANPDFDLVNTPLEPYLANARLESIDDTEGLRLRLGELQRTTRLVVRRGAEALPDSGLYSAVEGLIDSGYTSATAIARAGQTTFVGATRHHLGEATAKAVYEDALVRANAAGLTLHRVRERVADTVNVIPKTRPQRGDPSWSELFGAGGGCGCEHCRSVYGPAAYLATILEFLDHAPQTRTVDGAPTRPLDVLLGRRPDIARIRLDCRNATTPLPVLDLVNELLEDAVAGDAPLARQTEAEAEALRAAPAHERADAYAALAHAEYPWELPFDLNHEKVKLFAEHLDVDRVRLGELFGRSGDERTRCALGLSEGEWAALTTPSTGSARWGGRSVRELERVPVFLQVSGLEYAELEALTQTWFLSSAGAGAVRLDRGDDPCDIADDTLVGLDERLLDAIHRFVRLTRKLGWSFDAHNELDATLAALDLRTLDASALGELQKVRELASRHRLTPRELTALTPRALARRLGIGPEELELFASCLGIDLTSGFSGIRAILERWPQARATGMSVRELAHVLWGWEQTPPAFSASEEETRALLRALHRYVPARVEERLAEPEAQVALDAAVARYLESLDPSLSQEERASRAEAFRAAERAALWERFVADAVVEALLPFLRLPFDLVEHLVHATEASAVLLAATDDAGPAVHQAARSILLRLARAARIVSAARLDRRELDSLARARSAGFLDLALPESDLSDKLRGLAVIFEAKSLQGRLPRGERDLFDLISAASEAGRTVRELEEELAQATGWDPRLLGDLVSRLGLDAQAFVRPDTYARLHEAMGLLRVHGVDVDTLASWAGPVGPAVARSLEEVARAHQSDNASWYAVLTPISDLLRERKRDALVARLLHVRPDLDDVSDIYGHFLVDPEMSSCQQTSRIVQATASVQLFVQRVLLGLEPGARLTDADRAYWSRWSWLERYRVREADVKAFLYPENWIEPGLRDDKSPFFRELESELLQGDVTSEAAERALRRYVAKVDEIARLDIRALVREEGGILHVFGRTRATPHVHYYRRRLPTLEWTPWAKIDLPIEGDHVVPVVQDGGLLLFWMTFREERSGSQRTWKYGLHWSELRDGVWSEPRSVPDDRAWLLSTDIPPADQFVRVEAGPSGETDLVIYQHFKLGRHVSDVATSFGRLRFDRCRRELTAVAESGGVQLALLPRRSAPSAMRALEQADSGGRGDALTLLGTPEGQGRVVVDLQEIVDALGASDPLSLLFGVLLVGLGSAASQIHTFRDSAALIELLGRTPGRFQVLASASERHFTGREPFVVELDGQTWLVSPGTQSIPMFIGGLMGPPQWITFERQGFRFETLYHPFACDISEALHRGGVDGLLAPAPGPAGETLDRQSLRGPDRFEALRPTAYVLDPHPREEIDFSLTGALSVYNWELFFHVPMLVAERLRMARRYAEAQRWLHYVFDPTDVSSHPAPARYWRVKPLFEEAIDPPQSVRELLRRLASGDDEMSAEIAAWQADPFNPHRIARHRRVAYMKAAVMAYLDNLLAWADDEFARDTMESIGAAAQLYALAGEILGTSDPTVSAPEREALDYAALRERLDVMGNALVEIEDLLPADLDGEAPDGGVPPHLQLYFCIPPNERLEQYRATVADRLFRIRHCTTLDGRARQLPLFEPPIDPGLLVRARAGGLDLREVLTGEGAVRLPQHRYALLYPKAFELCREVRDLSSAVLTAREKGDAEELARLRARHEVALLDRMTSVKEQRIAEAREALQGLEASRRALVRKRDQLALWADEYQNPAEAAHVSHLETAHVFEVIGQSLGHAASISHLLPDVTFKAPAPEVSYGGTNLGLSLGAAGGLFQMISSQYAYEANMASIAGGRDRRRAEWELQIEQADHELEQLDAQIAGAKLRVAIAELERSSHEQQQLHARQTEDLLRRKYTNQELYGWMVSRLEGLHHRAYRMALDMAKRAERAARHELGLTQAEFSHIGFDHWDEHAGLLAGQVLHEELRRLDAAYVEHDRRELEITKHVSLRRLDPEQLVLLRETGACTFTIPELAFDLDFPGQYCRRIKTIRLTIPCVTGPYTNVSAKLTLERSWIRHTDSGAVSAADYPMDLQGDDPRVLVDVTPQQSIATSTAQRDSGTFELNFHDERYLPFEGAGAVSRWRLELPSALRQFDHDTISDVVLHVSYTARHSDVLAEVAAEHARDTLDRWLEAVGGSGPGLPCAISLRQELSSHLHRFLHPKGAVHEVTLPIEEKHLPYLLRSALREGRLSVDAAHLILRPASRSDAGSFVGIPVELGQGITQRQTVQVDGRGWGGLPFVSFARAAASPAGSWELRLDPTDLPAALTHEVDGRSRLRPDAIDDLLLVLVLRLAPWS